jgi:hypothetical protein
MTTTSDTVTLASPTLTTGDDYAAQVAVYRFPESPTIALQANGVLGSAGTATGWNTLSVTFTGGTANTVSIVPTSSASGPVYVDDVMVTQTSYVGGVWFSGDSEATEVGIYTWNGEPNASTSNAYYLAESINIVNFSDNGDGIPYTNAAVSYGTELLFNQANASSPAGSAIANNLVSQEKYGITQTSVDTLLSTFNAVESLASYYVTRYGEPEYRFQELTVNLNGLTGAQKENVLNLELGQIVTIRFTPNNVGSPIERYGQIIGINHVIGVDRHDITYSVGSLQFAYLVLNDVGFGILDGNVLGI